MKKILFSLLIIISGCSLFFNKIPKENPKLLILENGGYLSSDTANDIDPFLFKINNREFLFFSSDRDGNYDIFYAEKNPNGTFKNPIKLNSNVNTPLTEKSPSIEYYENGMLRFNFIRNNRLFYIIMDSNFNSLSTNYEVRGDTNIYNYSIINNCSIKTYGTLNIFINNINISNTNKIYSGGGVISNGKIYLILETEFNGYKRLIGGIFTNNVFFTYSISEYETNGINDISPFVDPDTFQVYFASDRYGKGNYDLYRINTNTFDKVLARIKPDNLLTNITGNQNNNIPIQQAPTINYTNNQLIKNIDELYLYGVVSNAIKVYISINNSPYTEAILNNTNWSYIQPLTTPSQDGIYNISVFASNAVSVSPTNRITNLYIWNYIFVTTNGSSSAVGKKELPLNDINNALSYAKLHNISKIAIQGGLYKASYGISPDNNGVSITNISNISIIGGWNSNFTVKNTYSILEKENNAGKRVILINNVSNVSLEGFLIKNGFASGNFLDNCGGGMVIINVIDLTLTNIIIENNRATSNGGGVFLGNGKNVKIYGLANFNNSVNGAGFYLESVSNSIFFIEACSNNVNPSNGTIFIQNSANNTFYLNVYSNANFASANVGVYMTNCSNNFISGTITSNFSTGNNAGATALFMTCCKDNVISVNISYNNLKSPNNMNSSALTLINSTNNIFSNSIIQNNFYSDSGYNNGYVVLLSNSINNIFNNIIISNNLAFEELIKLKHSDNNIISNLVLVSNISAMKSGMLIESSKNNRIHAIISSNLLSLSPLTISNCLDINSSNYFFVNIISNRIKRSFISGINVSQSYNTMIMNSKIIYNIDDTNAGGNKFAVGFNNGSGGMISNSMVFSNSTKNYTDNEIAIGMDAPISLIHNIIGCNKTNNSWAVYETGNVTGITNTNNIYLEDSLNSYYYNYGSGNIYTVQNLNDSTVGVSIAGGNRAGGLLIDDSIIGFWPILDDNFIQNEITNNYSLQAYSPSFVFGRKGKAIKFNGFSSSYAKILNYGNSFTNDFTITAWINVSDNNDTKQIFTLQNSSHNQKELNITIDSDENLKFGYYTSSGYFYTTTTKLNINTWYFVAFRLNNNTLSMFVNNACTNTATISGNRLIINNGNFYIGYDGIGSSTALNGAFDRIRIYNRALTDQEILALYNLGY